MIAAALCSAWCCRSAALGVSLLGGVNNLDVASPRDPFPRPL
jgi:hypothetical protein